MRHHASRRFWEHYAKLTGATQALADKAFAQLKCDPRHPSLSFKRLSGTDYWSVRVSEDFRALAVKSAADYVWFWIGPHDGYERKIQRK